MRRKRSIIALAIALVLLIGTYIYLDGRPIDTQPDTTPGRVDISRLDRASIREMTISSHQGEIVFQKQEGSWVVTHPYEVSVIQSTIEAVARTFSELFAVIVVEEEGTDLERYGLKSPVVTGEAVLMDDTTVVLYLGNQTANGSAYYLMKEGDPAVYTVGSLHGERLSSNLSAFRTRSLTQINFQEFRSLSMIRRDQKDIEILTNISTDPSIYTLNYFRMTKPYHHYRGIEANVMGLITEKMPSLAIKDFINDHPEDLSLYGLDEPSVRFTIKDSTNTLDLIFGNDHNEEDIYFQIAGRDAVYTMEKANVDFIFMTPYNMMEKYTYIVYIDQVDKIIIESAGTQHTLTLTRKIEKAANGNEVKTTTFYVDGKEVSDSSFRSFYINLVGMMIDSENIHEPSGQPHVRTTFYMNAGDEREVTIEYVPYNNDFYSVVRDGISEFLIARQRVTSMLEQLNVLKNE